MKGYSKSRKPFIGITANEGKVLMEQLGVKTMADQSKMVGCNVSYWSLAVNRNGDELLNDRFGVMLFYKLNKHHSFFFNQPRRLVVQLITESYKLEGKLIDDLASDDADKLESVSFLYKKYECLFKLKDIRDLVGQEELTALRELSGLKVSEIVSIYGSGQKDGVVKHSDMNKYFYGKELKLLSPDKTVRLWIALMIYYGVIDVDKITKRIKRLVKKGIKSHSE